MLTPAQVTTLRTLVMADPTLAAARDSADDAAIAAWLNTETFTIDFDGSNGVLTIA